VPALGAIGKQLPDADRVRLQGDLLLTAFRSRDADTMAAVLAAAADLRKHEPTEVTPWPPPAPDGRAGRTRCRPPGTA
jgi:hypothetical protein